MISFHTYNVKVQKLNLKKITAKQKGGADSTMIKKPFSVRNVRKVISTLPPCIHIFYKNIRTTTNKKRPSTNKQLKRMICNKIMI